MAIKWVDRVPTNPNRMKITPENGSSYFATVERADNPTVVGTPVNAQNLNAMQEAAGLTGNRVVYVATGGSNAVGDGSQASPYATIGKALSIIPKTLNGFSVTVNIAAGSYDENVVISGYSAGRIMLSGDGGVIALNSLTVSTSSYCRVNNMTLSVSPTQNVGIRVELGALLMIDAPIIINGSPTSGISVSADGCFRCRDSIEINNASVDAVVVYDVGRAYVGPLSGTGNKTGLSASYGGILHYLSSTLSAELLINTALGGRIYSGAQTQVPNY